MTTESKNETDAATTRSRCSAEGGRRIIRTTNNGRSRNKGHSFPFFPQILVGAVTVLGVAVYRHIPMWLSSFQQQPSSSPLLSDHEVIEKILGEEWIPRESELPSQMSITYPVTWNTQTQIYSTFLKSDPNGGEELLETFSRLEIWDPESTGGIEHSWWPDPSEETADTVWKKLAWKIWSKHPELSRGAAGYEYWTNLVTPDTPLRWHMDVDRHAWESSGETNATFPRFGAVYYGYPHRIRGGYLEIMAGGIREEWPSHVGGELERIRPEHDRLVVFNASKWHRVSPITYGDTPRIAFATNVWRSPPSMENYGPRVG